MQDAIIKQKAKMKWFEEGDLNSKYFIAPLEIGERRLHIRRVKDQNDQWIEGDADIGKAIVHQLYILFQISGYHKLYPSM